MFSITAPDSASPIVIYAMYNPLLLIQRYKLREH